MDASIILLVATIAATVLAGLPLLQAYLAHLPEAPSCPTCQGMTRQADERWISTVLSSYSTTARRACSRCGWAGRMKWRWAPRRLQS